MAAKLSQFRYFECREGWFPFRHESGLVSQHANSINIVLSLNRVFSWSAVRFGQIRKTSSWALAMQKALEVVGEIVTSMELYPKKVVQDHGRLFPRVLCALFRISNPAGMTVAWFLRVFWHEGPEGAEDSDILEKTWKDAEKQRAIISRRVARNPNERLAFHFSKVSLSPCCCLLTLF